MIYKIIFCSAAFLITSACTTSPAMDQVTIKQSEAEITSCMRAIRKLDEGRWAYMGTIATLNGKFRTYEAISVHAAEGPDIWSNLSFGGDVGGTEDTAETGFVKLVGTSMIPLKDGELNQGEGVKFLSCVGPDKEGRYEARLEYKLSNGDGTFDTSKNVSWYSAHGSYYAEDHYSEDGRVTARRSGVYTPADE